MERAWREFKEGWREADWGTYFLLALFPIVTVLMLLDYLIEEVLKSQPPGVQEFLLVSSLLNRFCAPLCDFLMERTGSQEVLISLEQSNLFIVPLDGSRQWYRYHQLFSDMLRQREKGRDYAAVHRRAAQ